MSQKLKCGQLSSLTGITRHTLNTRARTMFNSDELSRTKGNNFLLTPTQIHKIISEIIPKQTEGKIILIANRKGGVGKTTHAYLLSEIISNIGLKVCIIDTDDEWNLTAQYLSNININTPVLYDVINKENKKSIKDVIIEISPTLHIVPSTIRNGMIARTLSVQPPTHYLTWINELCIDYLRKNYDIIIIDTPPNLSTLTSSFGLCLKDQDNILIPSEADDFSSLGIQMFLDDIFAIRKSYKVKTNPSISIILNKFFNSHTNQLEMLLKFRDNYGDMLSNIIVRSNAKIKELITNKTRIGELKIAKEIFETLGTILRQLKILLPHT